MSDFLSGDYVVMVPNDNASIALGLEDIPGNCYLVMNTHNGYLFIKGAKYPMSETYFRQATVGELAEYHLTEAERLRRAITKNINYPTITCIIPIVVNEDGKWMTSGQNGFTPEQLMKETKSLMPLGKLERAFFVEVKLALPVAERPATIQGRLTPAETE